jgi:hypothetical protein
MSKELEALNNIITKLEKYEPQDALNLINQVILEFALTPPSADEVCKELSEYWNEPILLNPATCEFMNIECFANDINKVTHRQITKWYDHDNTYLFLVALPPHIIKLIGEFYIGVMNDEMS